MYYISMHLYQDALVNKCNQYAIAKNSDKNNT